MIAFSADWLRLREPFDRAARAAAAAALDLPARMDRRRGPDGVLSVIDLACGSGANLRELAPRLGGVQRWRLVDHDPALLGALAPTLAVWARAGGHRFEPQGARLRIRGRAPDGLAFDADVHVERLDLARSLDALPFTDAQLVTASALLDLVSADWLQDLTDRLAAARCAALFALNVDGRTEWDPPDADDALVEAAFAAHQKRDKGFGPALGATAADQAAQALEAAGYRVTRAASDWVVEASSPGPAEAAATLTRSMVEGMAGAALEQAPGQASSIHAWTQRRLAGLGRTRLRVGHTELMAMP
jgi:SAM-dependent methyltransferase